MRRLLPIRVVPLALVGLMLVAGTADAGWVTIKNDTTKTLVLQETSTNDGTVKRGTPVRLMPGETVREYRATPATKSIVVYESARPSANLYRGDLNCTEECQTFSITFDGKATCVKAVKPVAVVVKK